MANHGLEQTARCHRQDAIHLERETWLRVTHSRAAAQADGMDSSADSVGIECQSH